MKAITRSIVICIVAAAAGCTTSFKGTTVVSPRFRDNARRIAVMYETADTSASHLWFLSQLNQALMKNGYIVTERLHYPRVLHEMMLRENEQHTSTTNSAGNAVEQEITFRGHYGFIPSEIKDIGRQYALDYIAVYTHWPAQQACLRLVDCKTAEVVATSIFRIPQFAKGGSPADVAADIFVLSLDYAARQVDSGGRPVPVYLDVSATTKSEGRLSGIKKILYQKKIQGGEPTQYAIIYTMIDE